MKDAESGIIIIREPPGIGLLAAGILEARPQIVINEDLAKLPELKIIKYEASPLYHDFVQTTSKDIRSSRNKRREAERENKKKGKGEKY